jgi:CubicO group peptidase (beta-lactamase class C family)
LAGFIPKRAALVLVGFLAALAVPAARAHSSSPGQASNPSPVNLTAGLGSPPNLAWTPGSGATSHVVYFGATSSPKSVGTLVSPSYATPSLNPNTTYYWRVDEKNSAGTTKGKVWSFTTGATVDNRAAMDEYFPLPTAYVMTPGDVGAATWRYTFTAPSSTWTSPSFKDSAWSEGNAGFGAFNDAPGDDVKTSWTTSDIWMRRTFTLAKSDLPKVVLWARWNDSMEVYINGILASAADETAIYGPNGDPIQGWTNIYCYYGISDAARAGLKSGTNTIAVHVNNTTNNGYIDVGLADNPMYKLPMTGWDKTPALAAYGLTTQKYMQDNIIPAGVLAVMKGNEIVVERGFGYMDKARTIPVQPNAVMRLGSNDKIITLGAIENLLGENFVDPVTGQTITPNTPVFPLLTARGLMPLPGYTPDPNINQITIQNLIDHVSGITDLTTDVPTLLNETGVTNPYDYQQIDSVRWVYSMPLQSAPGTVYRYSSTGYFLLRYLIGTLKGDLLTYLKGPIFSPVDDTDVFLDTEILANRSPREPWYATQEVPYDRWIYLEDFTGLASTAESYARFLHRYSQDGGTCNIDSAGDYDPLNNGLGIFVGGMAGTYSDELQRRYDQVNIVVIFNLGGNLGSFVWVDPTSPQYPATLAGITDNMPATAWGAGPGLATLAAPLYNETGVGTGTELTWLAGASAVSQQVYFGTTPPFPLVSSQTNTTYFPQGLQPNTTYYWRVDEKDSSGNVTVGTTWIFTTAP